MQLALDDEGVHLVAAVIDRHVLDESTFPVSSSISTTATWVPNGNAKFTGSKRHCSCRFGSMPSGRSCAANAANPSSWMWTLSQASRPPRTAVLELDVVRRGLELVSRDRRPCR